MENLKIIKAWDLKEANEMASSLYRQTYLEFLKKIIKRKTNINIIADGIFLHNQIKETKEILENESRIEKFNKSAKISVFLKLLIQYAGHFINVETFDDKIYVEFTIFISNHHSFYNFSFDTDFIEIDNFVVNIYFVRTKEIICFKIIEKIENEQLKHIMLIADDSAYPPLLERINLNELILVRKYRNSFMPNDFKYLNIDNPIENSLEIKYKE